MRRETDEVGGRQPVHPLAVVADLCATGVEKRCDLLGVGLRVVADLRATQGRARAAAPGRVADHGGEVADEEDDRVTQLLEGAQLVQRHRVTQVEIGRRGIAAVLDAQGPSLSQPLDELRLAHQVDAARAENLQRALDLLLAHDSLPEAPVRMTPRSLTTRLIGTSQASAGRRSRI